MRYGGVLPDVPTGSVQLDRKDVEFELDRLAPGELDQARSHSR